MSFVDISTPLALHRRHEMDARIDGFLKKCDIAIQHVLKLQTRAQCFVEQLDCDPAELKERFLNCMKQLDEYTYLITDFNLAICKLDDTMVPDNKKLPKMLLPNNDMVPCVMNGLLEPVPSTSNATKICCPTKKPPRKRVPKDEQLLIAFSSVSSSSESVQVTKTEAVEIEELTQSAPGPEQITENENQQCEQPLSLDSCNLLAQSVLPVDHVYTAAIMHVDGPLFWVITDDIDEAFMLVKNMTTYYKSHMVELSLEQVMSITYCAFYDHSTDSYYRGLFIGLTEKDMSIAEVFLVDTGEVRVAPVTCIQPLAQRFCEKPPYARCCHLAGIDFIKQKDLMEKQEKLMSKYMGTVCSIEVDDNTSESIGVYVTLPSGENLNEMIVQEGLAVFVDKKQEKLEKTPQKPIHGPPEIRESDLDITRDPEHEDPLIAVTGYHNRDEAEICKHYKGGPDKTCFKGTRCTKRHVLKNPDGWTMDQVSVLARCRPLALPAPATWLRAHVTHVAHFDRFYVHLATEREKETVPKFGVVLPPTTLEGLVRDMNSPATRLSYKPLTTIPAPGEMVAALYPLDDQWYRAQVISLTRTDQCVEVQYIDYGNNVWVKENEVRVLPARLAALPVQAVRCVLAGVRARSTCSRTLAAARSALHALLNERTVNIHVIARDYDEITVEVYDKADYNLGEQLVATCSELELCEYSVSEDCSITRHVVP